MRTALAALALIALPLGALAQPHGAWTLSAPEQAVAGALLTVEWLTEFYTPGDYLDIAPVGLPGAAGYLTFAYTNPQRLPIQLATPTEPGTYELRYIQAGAPLPVRARRLITLIGSTASLTAPDRVAPGEAFHVVWDGPMNPANWITITRPDRPDDHFLDGYRYVTPDRAPMVFSAPLQPGLYEVRLVLYGTAGNAQPVVVRRPILVGN